MSGHPTTLELELARTGEAAGEIEDHVAACAACRAEMARLERFARDLGLDREEAPAALDAAVSALAGAHAARVRARLAAKTGSGERRRFARVAPWAAAAAGIAIVATAGVLWRGGSRSSAPAEPAPAVFAPVDDLNRDGRVDVLDAFALARAVESGDAPADWDVNRDGAVDAGDVDAVAMAAVSLGGGGR